jgi:hypothetical protein
MFVCQVIEKKISLNHFLGYVCFHAACNGQNNHHGVVKALAFD